jgi:NADH dehydrogenase [ubiquinone] 1 alpha subcomplex assembly factor 7
VTTSAMLPILRRVRSLSLSARGFGSSRLLSAGQGRTASDGGGEGESIISIDRSGLFQPPPPTPSGGFIPASTPLGLELETLITMRGPISVAEYMKQALCHPSHGYYMRKDVFGKAGDFTTAPEISQMFGELIGVWCVSLWEQMGRPAKVRLVEVGPGRGTLMNDLLRAASSFPAFRSALSVHLVDVSPALRAIQEETLAAHTTASPVLGAGAPLPLSVAWHGDLTEVPADAPLLLVAQELFDALPVHQFEYTEDAGWCERLVDVDESAGGLRFVLSRGATPASWAFLQSKDGRGDRGLIAPATAETTEAEVHRIEMADAAPGDRVEVCPAGLALTEDIAHRIATSGGGALFIDYGYNHASGDSVRAIKDHEFVNMLTDPGMADLSADVDFSSLARVGDATKGVVAHTALGQGEFLTNMGIQQRLAALLQQDSMDDDTAEALFESYERLVEEDQMGTVYKAMALTHESIPVPAGFPLPSSAKSDGSAA